MSQLNSHSDSAEIERFEHYIQADPDNTLLWISLADLYSMAGKSDEATACYEKCLLIDPHNQVAQSRLASLWIEQGRYQDAETALRELQRNEPESPVLHHNLGVALYAQQRWNDALDAFRCAQRAGLEDPNSLAYIVHSLHQSGAVNEALETARKWLEISPDAATEGYLALLEMDHGSIDTARERAERVLQEDPGNADASAVIGNWCLETQQIDSAEHYFDSILASRPNNPRGLLGVALVYLYRQQPVLAVEALEQVLKLSPNHPGILVTLGWARFVNQDIRGAETAFRQAIDINRNFGEAHGGLACVLLFQQRTDEANQAMKRAFRLDRHCFGAIFAKSISLTLLGKVDQGTKMLANLMQQSPQKGSPPLIENLRVFLHQQGPRDSCDTLPHEDS
jgi:tetratricopeptide (TPR) repeat protein